MVNFLSRRGAANGQALDAKRMLLNPLGASLAPLRSISALVRGLPPLVMFGLALRFGARTRRSMCGRTHRHQAPTLKREGRWSRITGVRSERLKLHTPAERISGDILFRVRGLAGDAAALDKQKSRWKIQRLLSNWLLYQITLLSGFWIPMSNMIFIAPWSRTFRHCRPMHPAP